MENLDVVIIGAGPSGLASALVLSKAGLDVTVFEKNNDIGVNPRGETIRPDHRIEALLGPGFLDSQKIHQVKHRTYFSHTGLKTADREISSWNYIIDWKNFINEMASQARKAGAKIVTSSTVKKTFTSDEGPNTVEVGEIKFVSKVVIDCSGSAYSETLSSRQKIPVQKKILSGFEADENKFYYFFHVDENAPMIATIFPRGNGEAELLIMLLTDCSSNPLFTPSLKEAEFIMESFAEAHPKFQDITKQCSVISKYCTTIPMKAPGTSFYKNGTFYTGDNIGLIESRGGSGIKSSIVMAAALAEQIHKHWPDPKKNFDKITHDLQNHPMFKELQNMDRKFGKSRRLLFSTIKKPGQMDFMWPMLQFFLR